MMSDILTKLIVMHIILCIVYAIIWNKIHKENSEAVVRFIFALFIPAAGFVLFALVGKIKRDKADEIVYKAYANNKDRIEDMSYMHHFNKEEELNKIPIDEALNMNEYKVRRKMVMNTLLDDDIYDYLSILKEAMNNTDTETSHYATSVVLEMQKNINNNVQAIERDYKKSPDDIDIIKKLEYNYEKIIFSEIYDERNTKRYYERYKQISDRLFKEELAEEKYYLNRIKIDFKIGDLTNAGEMCEEYKKRYPHSEDMVICNIEYYILTNDSRRLNQFLKELKYMPVRLTKKSLEYVRFFADA